MLLFKKTLNKLIMRNLDKKKGILNVIVAIGIIILIGMIAGIYNSYLRTLPQDYTIGEVIKIWKPAKGGTEVGFIYIIDGEEYKESVSQYGYEDVAKVGRRFLVEYPEGHNGAGVMHLDKPAPEKLEAPLSGWDKMPPFAK